MSLNSVPFNFRYVSALAKKVVTHHIHHANSEVKVTVEFFTKQGIIYDIIKNLLPAAEDTGENCREQDWSQPAPAWSTICRQSQHNKTCIKDTNVSEDFEAKNCTKVFKDEHNESLSSSVSLAMDDEKYFTLTSDIAGKRSLYTSDPSTIPPEVKFKRRTKIESKLLVWWAVSAKGRSSGYIHRSNTEIYLNECIRNRLIPFIKT